jgi:DNA repair protein RadA/Sms
VCTGLSTRRLSILLAVLEKRAGQALGEQDVFVNVVGGLRMGDPASDLAVIAALMSAGADRPFGAGTGFFGEVGLGGEVRAVSHGGARLRAALDAGLTRVVVPAGMQVELGERADRVRFARHVNDVTEILREETEG